MTKIDEKIDELSKAIDIIGIQASEFSLADAVREGSSVTTQAYTWGNGENACVISAAYLSATARGYIKK